MADDADATAPRLDDARLRELGVVFLNPPLKPVRILTKGKDGQDCWVFPSEKARQAAIHHCTTTVTQNCVKGARAGCVLKALDECRGPRWLRWLPFRRGDPRVTEACEARVFQACISAAEGACAEHAGEFCPRSHPKALLCSDPP